ncbi:MAG: signal peptide peptidase SppA [Pseudoxanthomonas suwonensis]|nr:signal peptide peptidase SppA [Pseudoxanthomonas suwonensis]
MNQPRQRGPVFRFFKGAWDAVNFTRRLVFNLLFLLLLFIVLAALGSGDRTKPLAERTTLVFAPEGRLVEEYSIDPTSRMLAMALGGTASPGEVRLRDLVRALEAAKDDDRIERVLVRLDEFQGGGLAPLRTLADKLGEVRAAGKQVVAWGEGYDQGPYLLAAQADEVYADPMGGGVMLMGLASYGPYMRGLLEDKLGVNVHVFKVGEFKSAVEPFTRDDASPEAKEADLYWMNDLWQRHVADIATARKLEPAAIHAAIDSMAEGVEAHAGDSAALSRQQGLLDGLKTRREVEALLRERGVADDDADGGFRQVDVTAYLSHVDKALPKVGKRDEVAVVVAEGSIMDGEQSPGTVGGDSTAALLREALDDDNVKAVVLRVNSPGGSAFASEVINREVLALKEAGKPVVASMGHLAASGGYWISMNADAIYADPSTITGSIGVFGMVPTLEQSLDKVGIQVDGVATTRYAGAMDITRPLSPDVGRIVQASVDKIYRDFTTKVAAGRGRSVEQIDEVARGRVWSGAQAKDRGLVDELGGLDAALADAARRAKLEDGAWSHRYIEQSATGFARFLANLGETRIGRAMLGDSTMLRAMVAKTMPRVEQRLRMLEAALPTPGNPRLATPVAYCFCELD